MDAKSHNDEGVGGNRADGRRHKEVDGPVDYKEEEHREQRNRFALGDKE